MRRRLRYDDTRAMLDMSYSLYKQHYLFRIPSFDDIEICKRICVDASHFK